MQFQFGTGNVIGKRTDLSGQPVALFGVTQEWSLDTSQELVELLGQNKVAVDVAPAELKITGKVKFARMQANTFGNMLFGVAPTANSGFDIVAPENHSAIAATTFTVTAGTAFTEDLGVFYHNTGIALTPVTASPSAGQYVPGVSGTGTYTINAADESVAGGLDVFYMQSSTTLNEIDVGAQLMGVGPTLELDFALPYAVAGVAKKFNVSLYAVRIGKSSLQAKNKGYLVPEFDFQAFATPAGDVMKFAFSE